mgnify:CR=1 FL=1
MFGRKKMYKKGLADAMQAYEAFGKKQEDALAYMREEVRSGNKELKEALAGLGDELNGIYKYLNAQEKAALYQLSTPMDLKELDDADKRLLLAVLYQLAENEESALTDNQRAYIRSVQKYLEITNPQTFADLSAIENIDSIDVQKTFLRVVLEFYYLQDGDELNDEQEEIFDYFSVNKKQATIIENEVSRLFNAVGPEGVAEKYGYVPEEAVQNDDNAENRTTEDTSGCLAETNRISDDNFTDMTDLLMGWNWGKIIETRNYLYSHNYPHSLLINKATGEKTLLSGKHLPSDNDGRCVYGDCIFYESDDHIWSFDFSTCDSPRKLSDIETRKFSICGSYLAFLKASRYNESSIYLYNIDEEKLSKIADVLNCRGIVASKNGIYYITELPRVGVREEYVGSIACLYKYDTKTTTILFKLPREPYENDIWAVPNDHTMYIGSWNHIYSVDFSEISADDVAKVSRNLLTDYWDTPMAHFQGGGKVDPFENGVIYVAEEGVLKVFSYLTRETMTLATGAKEHHYIDGGLFKKSSSWDVPVAFYQIGDWIYYKVGGTDKARVSMKQPEETVIVKDLDFDVRQDIREKTPKVSVD